MSRSRVTHALRVGLGGVLIVVGAAGLVLPVIPGIPLLVAGVFTVGIDHPWMRPIAARLRRHGLLRPHETDPPR